MTTSGSTNVISGTVATQSGNVNGATVIFSDTIGSVFSSTTISTNTNGYFSTNFTVPNITFSTIDLVTVTAAENGYSQSQSTIIMQVNANSTSYLSVALNTFYPTISSAVNDFMIIGVVVTAGGLPVSGATVSFSDSRGSTFAGQSATTNASRDSVNHNAVYKHKQWI